MQKLLFALALFFISVNISADSLTISKWLVVRGPETGLPAFSETENIRGKPFTETDLFSFSNIDLDNHFPEQGKLFPGETGKQKAWFIAETTDSGMLNLETPVAGTGSTYYLATYITNSRWLETEVEFQSRQMLEVYLNGKLLESKTSYEEDGEEPGKITSKIKIPRGKHLLLLRTYQKPEDENPWQIRSSLSLPSYAGIDDVQTELHPRQGKTINHLLDGIKITSASLSPDGQYYAVNYSRTLPPSDDSEKWLEIKSVGDSRLVQSFRHSSIQSFSWAPKGNKFSYKTSRDGKATVWIYDIESGEYSPLLEDVIDFSSYTWSPDAEFLIYSISEEIEGENGDLKRLLGMQDRLPRYRRRQFLYRVDVSTGIKERLTHGYLSTSLHDISQDGEKILFSQSRPDYLERPYSRQDVFIMDLKSKEVDTIFNDLSFGISGTFSPDGKQLLITGGPSAFGSQGEDIPAGMIANNYDTQAYIYDIEKKEVDPITRDFDPSVSKAFWNKADNTIYLVATDMDYVRLFSYNRRNGKFSHIDTGEDVLNWIEPAADAPVAIYSGSGISSPPKVSLLDMETAKFSILENPEEENFKNVEFGENKTWDYTTDGGATISGRVYLPPGFDRSKKYPLIVYYYGGTTPVSRSFGGRYPYNMYAANGYVVYVLQPSGAIGFGQEFSAMHVNNWGITVADEIIGATGKFLDEHPFIDPSKVGCMGASYGGFMTMLLQTRTDIFAAAISHAGISSISSYWGEGYWGYGYSAEASAGSFPWNNRELYVDQSPLFSADKISTPLLLLHGSSDTNVPVGESIQLYVALKLLGQEVELIEVEGEDHHILTYSKRIAWSNTQLAWFDKWLKDQSQWWDEIYPEKNY